MTNLQNVRCLALLATMAVSIACDGGSQVDCKTVTAPSYAAMTAWKNCTSCHATTLSGASRAGAPADINFDDYADAVADADRALSEVESGSMPPGGKIAAADKSQIVNWASCDTPQ